MRSPLGLLLLLLPALVASPAAAQTLLKGTLLGSDGRPPKMGVVQWEPHALTALPSHGRNPEQPEGSVHPDAKGHFELRLPGPGAYRIWFRTADDAAKAVSLIIPDEATARAPLPSIAVKLARLKVEAPSRAPGVRLKGPWRKARTFPMEEDGQGGWRVSVPTTEAWLDYHVVVMTDHGLFTFPNPQEEKVVFDDHYLSRAPVREGQAHIRLDLAALEAPARKFRRNTTASVTFSDEKHVVARISRLAESFTSTPSPIEMERPRKWKEGGSPREAAQPYLAVWRNDRETQIVRDVAGVLALAQFGYAADDDETDVSVVNALLDGISPKSLAWGLVPPAKYGRDQIGGTDLERRMHLVRSIYEHHPDRYLRAHALYALYSLAKRAERHEYTVPALRLLTRSFSDFEDLQNLLRYEDSPRKRGVGQPLMSLGLNTSEGRLDDKSLKDRWTLIVYSTPGCGMCDAIVPDLAKVRSTYPDTILRMVTVSLHVWPAELRQALAAQPPQPWEHAAIPTSDAETRLDEWEIWKYPTLFLVDPDGRIAAVDETLQKHGSLPENVARVLTSQRSAAPPAEGKKPGK